MPRELRITTGGIVYHVLNRGQGKKTIFSTPGDFNAFQEIFRKVVNEISMRVLSFCLMPNHWHLVLYPMNDGDLPTFLHDLTLRHAKNWHAFRGTTGSGHLYQDRYRSFPVLTDEYFLQVNRYVERNALRANLVTRAEDWSWSSAYHRTKQTELGQEILSQWPVDVPENYLDWLNTPQDHEEEEKVRTAIQPKRGRPKKHLVH